MKKTIFNSNNIAIYKVKHWKATKWILKKVSTSAIVNINHIIEQNYIRSSNTRFVIFVNKLSRMNAHARAHTPTRTNTKKQIARGVRLPNKVMSGQVRGRIIIYIEKPIGVFSKITQCSQHHR